MVAWIREHKEVVAIVVTIVGIVVGTLMSLISRIPVWYEDNDEDGFGNPEVSKTLPWRPSGFVRNNKDCYDGNSDANPNAEMYFGMHRGDGSFDYDCNGTSVREQDDTGSCSNGTANQGWNGAVPACGQEGHWLVDCDRKFRGYKIDTVRETAARFQKCR